MISTIHQPFKKHPRFVFSNQLQHPGHDGVWPMSENGGAPTYVWVPDMCCRASRHVVGFHRGSHVGSRSSIDMWRVLTDSGIILSAPMYIYTVTVYVNARAGSHALEPEAVRLVWHCMRYTSAAPTDELRRQLASKRINKSWCAHCTSSSPLQKFTSVLDDLGQLFTCSPYQLWAKLPLHCSDLIGLFVSSHKLTSDRLLYYSATL